MRSPVRPREITLLILAIDTATEQVSVALGNHEGVLGLVEVSRGRRHAETVAPSIEFLCRHTGVGVDRLAAIAVDVGPGLFTGMRVGLATVKAMAGALGVPVLGVSSLDVLAEPVVEAERIVVTVVDARRSEVFYGFHRPGPGGGLEPVGRPAVGRVDDLAAALADRGQAALCVGDGAIRYRADLVAVPGVDVAGPAFAHPSAAHLLAIAQRRAAREEWTEPAALAPLYLRPPDAQINWQSRGGTVA